jgi:hypothetical protein
MDRQQALYLALMRGLQQRGIRFAFPTQTLNLVAGPQQQVAGSPATPGAPKRATNHGPDPLPAAG